MASTLDRPPKRALQAFHAGQVGRDTVRTFLERGWSLAICCKACERLVEWTPPMLAQRCGARLETRIAELPARLVCAGAEGCGSHEIAVFPHLFDGAWSWPPPETGP